MERGIVIQGEIEHSTLILVSEIDEIDSYSLK